MAHCKDKPLTLSDWITEVGPENVAKLMKVERSTVFNWRKGYCYPRVDQMRKIKKYTNGRVTYDAIIDPTPATKKGRLYV